jgi:hypothetical protein
MRMVNYFLYLKYYLKFEILIHIFEKSSLHELYIDDVLSCTESLPLLLYLSAVVLAYFLCLSLAEIYFCLNSSEDLIDLFCTGHELCKLLSLWFESLSFLCKLLVDLSRFCVHFCDSLVDRQ